MLRPPRKLKLTEFTVKNLKPEKKPFLAWDTLQANFAVRVEPIGYRSVEMRLQEFTVGSVIFISAQSTRLVWPTRESSRPRSSTKWRKDVIRQAERKAQRGAGSFDDLADRYLEYAKRKNRSWKQATRLVRNHLRPIWGKLPAENISRADVRAMMTRITAPDRCEPNARCGHRRSSRGE